MKEIFDTLVWDKDSLSSVIDYSDVFKGYFADLTKKVHEGDLEGVGVRNLGMARHRFESTQKPLSRLVLWCDAAIGLLCTSYVFAGLAAVSTRLPSTSCSSSTSSGLSRLQ